MDPFLLFTTTDYVFLQLDSGSGGNRILAEFPANGIVKLRDGMLQADNVETENSTATVHIRPTEPFLATLENNLVGHGIRIADTDYRIIAQVEGKDFDLGQTAFYKVTLKRENLWDESDLPLE